MPRIFFDHISTTPLDPRAFEAMRPYLFETYGNPSSHIHDQGQAALRAVDAARAKVAAFVGAAPAEIVFTSGATESNNLAIKGVAEACAAKGRHLVVSEIEHYSILNALIPLRNRGWEVTTVAVDEAGRVDPDDVRKSIRPDTVLVSVMHANAEIGTIEPLAAIVSSGSWIPTCWRIATFGNAWTVFTPRASPSGVDLLRAGRWH